MNRAANLATPPVARLAPRDDRSRPKPKLAIAVGFGWGVRNYLLSETFEQLRRSYDLLIVSPFAQYEEFRQRFEQPGVQVWGQPPQHYRDRTLSLMRSLTVSFFYHFRPTNNRNLKLNLALQRRRKRNRGKLHVRMVRTALRAARYCACKLSPAAFPLMRRGYRRMLKSRWPVVAELRDLYRREQVDAVFSTNFMEHWEAGACLAAEWEGLPTIAAITSWDNPSTKRFPLCNYDAYLAWSPLMQDDMRRYMGVGDAKIVVTGAPQFDFYFDPRYYQTRAEFCRAYGLDPARKIVVYSTVTPGLMPDGPELTGQVHDLWCKDLPGRPQLLVRLHPKDRLERYEALRNDPRRQDIVWTLAGQPLRDAGDQWCPDRDDMIRAVNTVRHGDVNVQAAYSTMMLDFAALDKPVVMLRFNSRGETHQSQIWETYEHLQPIVQSGAMLTADNLAEAEHNLRDALERPERLRQARQSLIELELGQVDGRAGTRVAQAIDQTIQARLQKPHLRKPKPHPPIPTAA